MTRHDFDRIQKFIAGGPDANTPTTIDKYRVVTEIGRGGMGVVYRAIDPDLKRTVAIKVLREGSDAPLADHLQREAATAAHLRHPGIVTIHDVGRFRHERGSLAFIVMDFIEGQTLSRVAPGLTRAERLDVLEQVADAVGYAHERGVVHRDVKPDNILIETVERPDGTRSLRAFLTDFGLAHLKGSQDPAKTGHVLGTPVYMAPEQVAGRKPDMGPWTDVWGLGVVLYELMAGRRPFEDEDLMRVYEKISRTDPPSLRSLDPAIPPDVETICAKALEKNPAHRYPAAAAMTEDLRRYRRGEPILGQRRSLWNRMSRAAWRRRGHLLPLIASVILVAIATGVQRFHSRRKAQTISEKLQAADRKERDGNPGHARDLYRETLVLDPGNVAAREGVDRTGRLLERKSRELAVAQEEAAKLVEAGRPSIERAAQDLYRSGSDMAEIFHAAEEGRGCVERATEMAPGMAQGHYWIARAREIEGRSDLAEEALRKAIEFDDSYAAAHYLLARILLERSYLFTIGKVSARDLEPSRALVEEVRRLLDKDLRVAAGSDQELRMEIARAYYECVRLERSGRDAETVAAEIGKAAERFDGRQGAEELHFLQALASVVGGNPAPALERALEIRPKFAMAFLLRAIARKDSRELKGSLSDLDEVIRLNPHLAEAYLLRAGGRIRTRRVAEGMEDFAEAIRRRPGYPQAHCARALVRWLMKDSTNACADLAEAEKSAPWVAENLRIQADRDPEPEMGLKLLDLLLAFKPDSGPDYIARARLKRDLKRNGEALEDVRRALRLRLSPTDRESGERFLQELEAGPK